jgi:hypothetical protein
VRRPNDRFASEAGLGVQGALQARVAALTDRLATERPPRERRQRPLAERARALNDLGIDR